MSHLVSGQSSENDFQIWAPNLNDVILVADVDEILKPDVLLSLSRCTGSHHFHYHHATFSWFSRLFFAGWTGPVFLFSRFYNFRFEWEFAGAWKHPQVAIAAAAIHSLHIQCHNIQTHKHTNMHACIYNYCTHLWYRSTRETLPGFFVSQTRRNLYIDLFSDAHTNNSLLHTW